MVGKALAAADKLEAEGIEAEVINIQVLRPLNVAPIIRKPAMRTDPAAPRRVQGSRPG